MAEIASVLDGGGSGPFRPLRARHQALAAGDAIGELVGLRPAERKE